MGERLTNKGSRMEQCRMGGKGEWDSAELGCDGNPSNSTVGKQRVTTVMGRKGRSWIGWGAGWWAEANG